MKDLALLLQDAPMRVFALFALLVALPVLWFLPTDSDIFSYAFILAVISSILCLGLRSAVNSLGERLYGCEPVSTSTVAALLGLLFVASSFSDHGLSVIIDEGYKTVEAIDFMVAAAQVSASLFIIFLYLAFRTSPSLAFIAVLVLIIFTFTFAFVLILITLLSGGSSTYRDQYGILRDSTTHERIYDY